MLNAVERNDGVIIPIKALPKSSRDEIAGEIDGQLKVAVTAAPEKGKANKAIVKVIAKELGVKKSAVSLLAGETSQQKKVLIRGLTIKDLQSRFSIP